MAVIKPQTSLDMLLIGRTGDGKSETANTILGRSTFPTSSDAGSMTTTYNYDFSNFDNYVLKVVDCPGLGDTRLGEKEDLLQFIEAVELAIANNPEGYHAFLYVIKFGNKFTRVDKYTVLVFKALLGEMFIKNHGIIVMTYGDCFQTEPEVKRKGYSFNQWLSNQKNDIFKDVLKECKGRAILFDNRTDNLQENNEQKRKLIDMIDQMAGDGKRYTNDDFKEAEKKRLELLSSFSKEKEMQDYIDKIGILIAKIKNGINDKCGSQTLVEIKKEIDDLDKTLKTASKSNTLLKKTLSVLSNLYEVFELLKQQEKKEKKAKDVAQKLHKSMENLEKRYLNEKINHLEPFVPKIIDSMKGRFSIERLFDFIANIFK